MKHLFCITLALCIGCHTPTETKKQKRWCSGKEDRDALVSCIERITRAGNPMSDEEGEDLVNQVQSTCEETVCPERWVTCSKRCFDCYEECWLP